MRPRRQRVARGRRIERRPFFMGKANVLVGNRCLTALLTAPDGFANGARWRRIAEASHRRFFLTTGKIRKFITD